MYKGTRGKNCTGARLIPCTWEPGGRTVQELDLSHVQGNQVKGTGKNCTGARLIPCTREPGGRTVQELDLSHVQGNQGEEQYRSYLSHVQGNQE